MGRHRSRRGQLIITISAFIIWSVVGALLGFGAFLAGVMLYLEF